MNILVTGVTGQCGSYLADQLLARGDTVHGLVRRVSTQDFTNIKHLIGSLNIIDGDLTDPHLIADVVSGLKPDMIFNAAAQSHVGYSFKSPRQTFDVNFQGVLNLLEAIRLHSPDTRMLQFSTSEMFGGLEPVAYTEDSIFHPRSPYGVAKTAAHHAVINYREAYNLHVMCGIFFNQESERRGLNFVTRKATRSAAEIMLGIRETVGFGNIDSFRDWGYSPDYMRGAIMALEYDEPTEFIFATGKTHCIRDMLKAVFDYANLGDYQNYIYKDMKYWRPSDVKVLIGDASKANKLLGWKPEVSFEDMMIRMYDNDLKQLLEEVND